MRTFRRLALAISMGFISPAAQAIDGMIALACVHSSKVSMDRLEGVVKSRGMKVFARIDHAAGARAVGIDLAPTEVMLFGHPRLGSPLLKCSQTYGIDLPLRVLAWEDASGRSWLGYADPVALGHNHPDAQCDAELKRLTMTLDEVVREAARQ